jgi:hypothetical protein
VAERLGERDRSGGGRGSRRSKPGCRCSVAPAAFPRLRREEVALLAGVSVDYYIRLKRGNLSGVSESVLAALVRALQLDDAERAHLFDLARAAGPAARTRRRPAQQTVPPRVQRIIDALSGVPAFLQNGRLDVLAVNPRGRALYADMFGDPVRPANHARFVFFNPRAQEFYADWDRAANDTVAILRTEAGRDPHDRACPTSSVSSRRAQPGAPHPLGRA